jgi:hypothetical protein
LDFCPNCGQLIVWGCDFMLKVLSGFIVDNEFVLIDKNPPFSATDWELFDEALGDEKIMTRP